MCFHLQNRSFWAVRSAFTLVEVMVSMAVAGIMFVSLYAGITHGLSTVQLARENLRASQIMTEKLETIRLYGWDQINSNGFIPSTFVAWYYPSDAAGAIQSGALTNAGIPYTGRLTITDGPAGMNYSTNLKTIHIQVAWSSGRMQHEREMTTYFARQGLHRFAY